MLHVIYADLSELVQEMQEMGDRGEAQAGGGATAIDPGDNEPACSICLGNFVRSSPFSIFVFFTKSTGGKYRSED